MNNELPPELNQFNGLKASVTARGARTIKGVDADGKFRPLKGDDVLAAYGYDTDVASRLSEEETSDSIQQFDDALSAAKKAKRAGDEEAAGEHEASARSLIDAIHANNDVFDTKNRLSKKAVKVLGETPGKQHTADKQRDEQRQLRLEADEKAQFIKHEIRSTDNPKKKAELQKDYESAVRKRAEAARWLKENGGLLDKAVLFARKDRAETALDKQAAARHEKAAEARKRPINPVTGERMAPPQPLTRKEIKRSEKAAKQAEKYADIDWMTGMAKDGKSARQEQKMEQRAVKRVAKLKKKTEKRAHRYDNLTPDGISIEAYGPKKDSFYRSWQKRRAADKLRQKMIARGQLNVDQERIPYPVVVPHTDAVTLDQLFAAGDAAGTADHGSAERRFGWLRDRYEEAVVAATGLVFSGEKAARNRKIFGTIVGAVAIGGAAYALARHNINIGGNGGHSTADIMNNPPGSAGGGQNTTAATELHATSTTTIRPTTTTTTEHTGVVSGGEFEDTVSGGRGAGSSSADMEQPVTTTTTPAPTETATPEAGQDHSGTETSGQQSVAEDSEGTLPGSAGSETLGNGHEQLTHPGDTIWDHAESRLERMYNNQPTDRQVFYETQRILNLNNISWEQARYLDVGTDFLV